VANINWPVTSAPGARFGESAGRLVNAFAEPLGEGARAPIVRKRVPGLTEAATSSFFGCRALYKVGSTILAGFSGRVVTVDLTAGTMTNLGSLAGSERFTIAHNNAATPNIVAVTDTGAFNLFTNSAPTSFADGDLPASPTSVCFQSGYFFFSYADGRIFASGLNAVSINALDFTTAQTRPGGVTRLMPYNGELLAFGPNCHRTFTATPATRPASRIPMGTRSTRGCTASSLWPVSRMAGQTRSSGWAGITSSTASMGIRPFRSLRPMSSARSKR
jgi:hypothetical protein